MLHEEVNVGNGKNGETRGLVIRKPLLAFVCVMIQKIKENCSIHLQSFTQLIFRSSDKLRSSRKNNKCQKECLFDTFQVWKKKKHFDVNPTTLTNRNIHESA